jgi:hypothetical protein
LPARAAGSVDASDDGVEFLRLQGRDDSVPVLGDDLALDLHLRAQRIGNVDVEAFDLAVRCNGVEGRIGAFGADLHFLLRLRQRAGRHHQHGSAGCRYDPFRNLHFGSPYAPVSGRPQKGSQAR